MSLKNIIADWYYGYGDETGGNPGGGDRSQNPYDFSPDFASRRGEDPFDNTRPSFDPGVVVLSGAQHAWNATAFLILTGQMTIEDVPEHLRLVVQDRVDNPPPSVLRAVAELSSEEVVPEDDLLNGDPDLIGDTQIFDDEGNPLFEPGIIYGPNGDPIGIDVLLNEFPPFEADPGDPEFTPPPNPEDEGGGGKPPSEEAPSSSDEETGDQPPDDGERPPGDESNPGDEQPSSGDQPPGEHPPGAGDEPPSQGSKLPTGDPSPPTDDFPTPIFEDSEWIYKGNGNWENKETGAVINDPDWDDPMWDPDTTPLPPGVERVGSSRGTGGYLPGWGREHPWKHLGGGKYRNIFTGQTIYDPNHDPDNERPSGERVGLGNPIDWSAEPTDEDTTGEEAPEPDEFNQCPAGWVYVGQAVGRGICVLAEDPSPGDFDLGDSETATTDRIDTTEEGTIPAADTVKTTETSEPIDRPVTTEPIDTTDRRDLPVTTGEEKRLTIPTADTVKTNETSEPEELPVTTETPVTTDRPVITGEETTTDLPVTTEPVVEPPPPSGGGGGGGSGMFSPHIGGINYALPQFTGVPYKLDKDYNVSLNRIIEENLFSDFDVA